MSPTTQSMFGATALWHAIELPAVTVKKNTQPLSDEELAKKKSHAKKLLKEENEKLELTASLSKGDRNFVNNILQSGTLSDKVSALTLLVQESPLHSLKTMDTLMTMTQKKARKEAVMAIESLKDLFVGSVLPDRKLIYFADRPLSSQEVEDRHLILWAYEDHLKKFYFKFIQQLEALSHDPLEHVRLSMIRCFHDLLTAKPEQEQNLLKLLVNKLGDKENKVAAKTSQLLVELLIAHPGMKMYVVREIEQLLLRPGVTQRAQYYSLITLNQTILSSKDKDVANKLVEIYFIFFRRLLNLSDNQDKEDRKKEKEKNKKNKHTKKGEKDKPTDKVDKLDDMESKMISAILTGVNRAFHFAELADEAVEKHLEVLFKITHTGTFNAAIQALSLIFSITLAKQIAVDRFYRLLYESMLDPRLITTSKQAMYLNLLFKAIRADADLKRVKAFVKRMIQIAGYHQPPFICGIFFILSQLSNSQPSLRAMLTTPEEEDEEEHYEDVQEEYEEVNEEGQQEEIDRPCSLQNYYDGRQRDPRFAKAETSCLWELIPFRNHYHPTVSKYADILFRGEKIDEQPEMHLHTLIHFLDRFVYRNPKKTTGARGKSLMQPLALRQDGGVMLTRGTVQQAPVNSEEFWRKKVDQVPVDEIFFHKYFTQKRAGEESQAEKKKKRKLNEDEDEFDDDEVYRAMLASMPGGLNDEDLGSGEDVDEDEELFDEDELAELDEDESDVQVQEGDNNTDDSDNGDIPFLDDDDYADEGEDDGKNIDKDALSSVFAEAPPTSDEDDDDDE